MRSIFFLLAAFWSLAFAGDTDEIDAAGIDPFAKATYFVSHGYVFALNVVANGDVYYHMSGPSVNSWIGIGFGDRMKGTRMLIAYLASNGRNITNSCRIAYGNSEPEQDPNCVIEKVTTDHYAPFENTISPGGVLIAHSVCRNCWNSLAGPLPLDNEEQPFIYALGPNRTLHSDDPNASLRLHEFYGSFTMNMTQAVNATGDYGRVPAPQDPALQVGTAFWAFANYYSSTPYNTGTLVAWAPTAHAVFMCLAFLLVFPLGALSLRLIRRATFHAGAQLIGLAFVVIGFGFGYYASTLFNKSKNFNSAHQIIGLFVFAALFLQVGLGLTHHLIFLRTGVPTIVGKIHRVLGITVLVVAIVNGGLGFHFAQNPWLPYVVVVPIMALLWTSLSVWILSYNRHHMYTPEKEDFRRSREYGKEIPEEYEMQGPYVQTPRTPFFREQLGGDDPENYRAHLLRNGSGFGVDNQLQQSQQQQQYARYTDATPNEGDGKDPFSTGKTRFVGVDAS